MFFMKLLQNVGHKLISTAYDNGNCQKNKKKMKTDIYRARKIRINFIAKPY